MRCTLACGLLVALVRLSLAADLKDLPANTWVEIKYTTEQPADPDSRGQFARQGWNKVVYDPDAKRVLFYDRWIDKKHGGWTIYGNCLFGLDPAAGKLTPIKIDHWSKKEPKGGGYRTFALPENAQEPTPCPRHVYHAFEYVPELKSVFICNGANQSALDQNGKLVGHDLCDGMWRLDLKTSKWTQLAAKPQPPNRLDDAMAWCPDTKSLIYIGNNRQIWIFDTANHQWRKARHSLPEGGNMGQTIFYDPTQHRMLLLGGGPLDSWKKKPDPFRELWAFDPRTEEVKRLADGPTVFYSSHLAFDRKNRAFVAVAVFNKKEQPSGIFVYLPDKNTWHEIRSTNPIPPHTSWMGWMQLCYDSEHECLIAKVDEKFFAFRYVPAR